MKDRRNEMKDKSKYQIGETVRFRTGEVTRRGGITAVHDDTPRCPIYDITAGVKVRRDYTVYETDVLEVVTTEKPTPDCDLKIAAYTGLIVAKCIGCGFWSCFIPGSDRENEQFVEMARSQHDGQGS